MNGKWWLVVVLGALLAACESATSNGSDIVSTPDVSVDKDVVSAADISVEDDVSPDVEAPPAGYEFRIGADDERVSIELPELPPECGCPEVPFEVVFVDEDGADLQILGAAYVCDASVLEWWSPAVPRIEAKTSGCGMAICISNPGFLDVLNVQVEVPVGQETPLFTTNGWVSFEIDDNFVVEIQPTADEYRCIFVSSSEAEIDAYLARQKEDGANGE